MNKQKTQAKKYVFYAIVQMLELFILFVFLFVILKHLIINHIQQECIKLIKSGCKKNYIQMNAIFFFFFQNNNNNNSNTVQ